VLQLSRFWRVLKAQNAGDAFWAVATWTPSSCCFSPFPSMRYKSWIGNSSLMVKLSVNYRIFFTYIVACMIE
jgi:hypothetical protein